MAGQKQGRRSSRGRNAALGEIIDGLKGSLCAFLLVFLLCVGLAGITSTVLGIETGQSSHFIRFVQIGWQLQLLAQFVNIRISDVLLGVTPLLLTLIVAGLISAFMARRGELQWRGILSGLILWLVLTILVQWSLQSDVEDAWYLAGFKIVIVYLLSLAPHVLRQNAPQLLHRMSEGLRACVIAGRHLFRLLCSVLCVAAAVITLVWMIRGWGAYSHLSHLLGMKSVSFGISLIFSLLWLPNVALWSLVWIAGGTIQIGTIATYAMGRAAGSGLPLLPILGFLPPAVGSSALRGLLTAVLWLIAGISTACFALLSHGFGWADALRSAFGEIREAEEERASTPSSASALGSAADPASASDASARRVAPVHAPARRMISQFFSLVIAVAGLAIVFVLLLYFSDGALGVRALAFIGVQVWPSLAHVLLPIGAGAAIGWLLVCCVCLILVALRNRGITPASTAMSVRHTIAPLFSRTSRPGSSSETTAASDPQESESRAEGRYGQEAGSINGYPETISQSVTDFFRQQSAGTDAADQTAEGDERKEQ